MQNTEPNKPRRGTKPARPEKRKPSDGPQTLIIPHISPEMLESARRAASEGKSQQEIEQAALDAAARSRQQTESAGQTEVQPQPQPQSQPQPVSRPEKHRKTRAEAEAELKARVHDNHLWLNNPLMMQGLGLAPVVVAATTGRNALMLCAAMVLLLTTTRMLAVAICHLTGNRFRPVIYAYSAAILYIPAYCVLYALFGADLTLLGVYLPLLVVEPAIVKRLENPELETMGQAFRRGINNTVGICLAILLVGVLRELLGAGSVFGNVLLDTAPLPIAAQPAGGFILLGVIAALWTAIANAYIQYKQEEVRHNYAERRS